MEENFPSDNSDGTKYEAAIQISETESNFSDLNDQLAMQLELLNDSDEDNDSEATLKQGCWEKFLFFVKHSYRDAFRHPCHFCLAFCATFTVVLASLLV